MTTVRMDACRCCGCTEDRACPGGCSWVKVERGSEFKSVRTEHPIPPLCSACSGTPVDVLEACRRIEALSHRRGGGFEVTREAATIARALRKRVKVRTDAVRQDERDPMRRDRMRRRRERVLQERRAAS